MTNTRSGSGVELRMDGESGEYYVYALSSVPAVGGQFDPQDIFYVGKGKGLRWTHHFREAATAARSGVGELSPKHAKIAAIVESIGSGGIGFEQYAFIVKGGLAESEAYMLEALTIELLRKSGVDLTNVVSGHHSYALLKPASEVRKYYSAEKMIVDGVLVHAKGDARDVVHSFVPSGSRGAERLTVVVKGSTDEFARYSDVLVDGAARFDRATSAEIRPDQSGTRRPWDPNDPWTETEAVERARHYWRVSPEVASALVAIADDGRLRMCMVVADPRAGQSVVRFEWEVEPGGQWLDYGDSIGFPLGRSFDGPDDSWVGRCLIREFDGKQLMENAQACAYAAETN